MAQHELKFTVPKRRLGWADVENNMRRDSEALGRLKASNGTVIWVPKNKTDGFKVGRVKFDVLMQQRGKTEN